MANISSAHGTFTIHTNNIETMEALIGLMHRSLESGCDYGTYFTDYRLDDEQFEIEKINDTNYKFYSSFDGTGRWTYANNIESMMRWMKEDSTEDELKLLKSEDFSYLFDFVDYEPGCETFYHSVMEVTHKKGELLESVQAVEHECEGIDITVVNLADAFGYSFGETMEELYYDLGDCDKERKEEILEELNNQREEIEEYFNKTLEELLQEGFPNVEVDFLEC